MELTLDIIEEFRALNHLMKQSAGNVQCCHEFPPVNFPKPCTVVRHDENSYEAQMARYEENSEWVRAALIQINKESQ